MTRFFLSHAIHNETIVPGDQDPTLEEIEELEPRLAPSGQWYVIEPLQLLSVRGTADSAFQKSRLSIEHK